MEKIFTSKNFDEEVLKAAEPVMVDFFAAWCGPCKMMAPVIEELASQYEGKAKIGKLDVDANADIAARYGVMTIPTIILFKDGKEVSKTIGVQSRDTLRREIEDIL